MKFKYFLAFLAVGFVTAAHAQDAANPAITPGGAATKQQDARPSVQRRANKAAAAERPACTLSVAPNVLLKPGHPVRVTWSTKNATSASIEGIGSVSLEPQQKVVDHPKRTKIYEMEVSGPKGNTTCRVAVAVPERTEPLHWPPQALAGMPADYLARVRASLAQAITGAKLISDYRWVGYAVASLLFEQDVDIINKYLAGPWEAPQHPEYGYGLFSMDTVRLYGLFNGKSGTFPGRLTPAAQRHMEEELYKVVSQTRFNDFRHASNPDNVWTLRGSDNHTFASQSSFLLVSQFLKNSPDLADRAFEDGRKPAEHYEAWRGYWSKVLDERAKRGIYIEVGSPTYEDETRQAIQNIRDFAEDPILRRKAEMLLDVTYALIAQDSLRNGVRGGAKSRVYTFRDKFFHGGDDPNYNLIFGPPNYVPDGTDQATSTYFPPPVVLKLGQDVAARGSYENVQRVPGVGERKAKVSTLDSEKSVLRYGFVTPSYVMGSFVLDPNTAYAPMSGQNRWQGAVFEGDRAARIAPRIARIARTGALDKEQRVMDGFTSLQDRNVLITQRSTGKGGSNIRIEVYVSSSFDSLDEEDGWIFVKEGAAFGAVRIVGPEPEAYLWLNPGEKNKNPDPNKNLVALKNPDSPIIIVASEASEYANDFSQFKAALKRQKIDYDRGVLRFADLTFHGPQTVGSRAGQTVDLSPGRLYDSPFVRSDWESGKIFMRFGNEAAYFDFSDATQPRKETSPVTGAGYPPGIGKAKAIVFPR